MSFFPGTAGCIYFILFYLAARRVSSTFQVQFPASPGFGFVLKVLGWKMV